MIRKEISSYPISIFIAGDLERAQIECENYCDEVGFCVTVTPTRFVYTKGGEEGVIVGIINYPRFPTSRELLWRHAETLAARLRVALIQDSYTVQAPDKTVWFSYREADQCV